MVSLVARPSSVGKQILAEFWLPKLDAKLAAPALSPTGLALFPGDSGLGLTLRVVQAMQSESGAAGFVQARPFNLWCRMRVGPRIPSCCPSNGKCEPMKNDLLNTEF